MFMSHKIHFSEHTLRFIVWDRDSSFDSRTQDVGVTNTKEILSCNKIPREIDFLRDKENFPSMKIYMK